MLSDDCISSKHLEFKQAGHVWTVRDLNSTNGTFVNERRTGQAAVPIEAGQEIRLADAVRLLVELG